MVPRSAIVKHVLKEGEFRCSKYFAKKKHTNHKNSNKANNDDNDVLYDIECYDLDDNQPDDILSSFDSEESGENECVVENKPPTLFFVQCQNKKDTSK